MQNGNLDSGSQSMVPGPVASPSPGNVLEMHMFRLHSRPTESEALQVGPSSLSFNKAPQ